jgi:hypothetical protein
MSLIVCSEPCRHQKDGYCALDSITRLTNGASTVCGYYEAAVSATEEGRMPVTRSQPE